MKKKTKKKERAGGREQSAHWLLSLWEFSSFIRVVYCLPEVITLFASCWRDVWRSLTWFTVRSQLTGFSSSILYSLVYSRNSTSCDSKGALHRSYTSKWVYWSSEESCCMCGKSSCMKSFAAPEGAKRSLMYCLEWSCQSERSGLNRPVARSSSLPEAMGSRLLYLLLA